MVQKHFSHSHCIFSDFSYCVRSNSSKVHGLYSPTFSREGYYISKAQISKPLKSLLRKLPAIFCLMTKAEFQRILTRDLRRANDTSGNWSLSSSPLYTAIIFSSRFFQRPLSNKGWGSKGDDNAFLSWLSDQKGWEEGTGVQFCSC